jgi:carotenoid cleavage dioxygenase-like enzyme
METQAADAPLVHAWSAKSAVPFFRVGNYAPISDELTTFDLPVEGAIPPELNGWYLRNGPNPRHETNNPRDWPYRWSNDYGARLGVLRRDEPYGPIRWFDIDPCYVFHVLNAFDKTTDDGKLIVLQVARYPELWREDGGPGFDAVMWSWTINLTRNTVTEQQIDERAIEFPRLDDRRAGMPAR